MVLLYLYGFVLIFEAIIKASKVQFFFLSESLSNAYFFFPTSSIVGKDFVAWLPLEFQLYSLRKHFLFVLAITEAKFLTVMQMQSIHWILLLDSFENWCWIYLVMMVYISVELIDPPIGFFSLIFYYTWVYDFSGCLKFGCLRFWHSLCGVTMCTIMVLQ